MPYVIYNNTILNVNQVLYDKKMKNFTNNIKHLCKVQGISQAKLAELIGTTRQSLNSILKHNNPNAEFLLKFSNVLNISIDDLLKKDLTL